MVEVKLHDIGEGMTEASITCFLVKAGDIVQADDPLVEVQTDKMTAEIPAPRSGVVKQILLNAGEMVKVGTTLLILEEGEAGSQTVKPELPVRILASPHTRKIARENKVNITEVTGTGPAGRITDEDVHAFLKAANASEAGSEREVLRKDVPNVSELPFRGRRKQIARKMVHSLQTDRKSVV